MYSKLHHHHSKSTLFRISLTTNQLNTDKTIGMHKHHNQHNNTILILSIESIQTLYNRNQQKKKKSVGGFVCFGGTGDQAPAQ